MTPKFLLPALRALALVSFAACAHAAPSLRPAVDAAIRPVMAEHQVPGVAVAVTVRGQRQFFNYGAASKDTGRPVTQDTLFEIGSLSKTFTATLGAYARERGVLDFAAPASRYLPGLAGSRFDGIRVIDLATYSAGGLPLQFPDAVTNAGMVDWFRHWKPAYPPGAQRLYSNPSIGLFGLLAANSLGQPFDALIEGTLFPKLALQRTYIHVPPQRMADYAMGYARDGKAVRVNPGVLDAQAYGVKTSTSDFVRFLEANLGEAKLEPELQRAIDATHVGQYRVGSMVQALGWETYAYPVTLAALQQGNSNAMAYQPHRIEPVGPAPSAVLLNKTGSTNGFGAYALFVPAKQVGIVILANRNYPIEARVGAAYKILQAIE